MKSARIIVSIAGLLVAAWLAGEASSFVLGPGTGQTHVILFLAVFSLLATLVMKIIYAGRSIDRILVILGGFMGACFSAGFILTILLWIVGVVWSGNPRELMLMPLIILPGTLVAVLHIAVFATLPTCLLIIYAEFAKIRSPLFYALAGTVGGELGCILYYRGALHIPELVLVAVVGLGGGLTYWRIAGRSAGQVPGLAVSKHG